MILCLEALRQEANITVVSSYHTATEDEQSAFASPLAQAGLAMVLSRGNETMALSMALQLAVEVLHVCGPVMSTSGGLVGITLYPDAVGVYRASAVTSEQDVPLAFANVAAGVGLSSTQFDRYLRSSPSLSQSLSCSQSSRVSATQAPPASFNPGYIYPLDVDRSLRDVDELTGFDFCAASNAARVALATKAWQAIEQMAADKQVPPPVEAHLAATRQPFIDCLTTCYPNSNPVSLRNASSPLFQRFEAVCSEAVRRLPQRFGSLHQVTDSCHFYRMSGVNSNYRTQRMRDNACTMGLCLDETTPFAFWDSILTTKFAPTIAGVTLDEEPLWSNDQPTPVYRLLQETFAMECHGSVTVWVVDARDIARMANIIKALFVSNPSVTTVDFRCDSTDKLSVQDALANLVAGWQLVECGNPRLLLPAYTVTSLDEYDSE
jgi:hypothetical protein